MVGYSAATVVAGCLFTWGFALLLRAVNDVQAEFLCLG